MVFLASAKLNAVAANAGRRRSSKIIARFLRNIFLRRMIESTNEDFEDEAPGWSLWRRRWTRLALIWGIWTFIGVVFTLQSYFTSYRSEQPMTLIDSAYLQFTWP